MNGETGEDIDEAAALWLQRLHDPAVGADAFAAFERWRDCDPRHAQAFDRVARAWDAVGEHASAPEMLNFRQDALSQARALAGSKRAPRWWPYAAAASIGLLCVATAATYFLRPPPTQTFATQVGERETLILADNSHVDVDADSAIVVDFTQSERRIHVLRGQAYFQVARNRVRPFVVDANGRNVVATGTEFDVQAIPQGLQVMLAEGHVLVRAPDASGGPEKVLAALVPGDEFTTASDRAAKLVHGVNVMAVTAWRQGKLLFDDTPLADALAEMGRYSRQSIALDPSAANIRVSGVFTVGDMAGFIGALQNYYAVKVVTERSGGITLTRR